MCGNRHCKREEKLALVDAFDEVSFDAGVDVIQQGDMGDNFYVVDVGSLDIYLDKIGKVSAVWTQRAL